MMLSIACIASGWLVGALAVSANFLGKTGKCKLRKEVGREEEA
jgi:hypothetical protein